MSRRASTVARCGGKVLLPAFGAMVLVCTVAIAADESVLCPETEIRAAGWSEAERDRVCSASAAAVAFLRAAGVPCRADGLVIRPLPPASGQEDQPVMGCCDTLRNEIRVLSYDDAVAASRKFPPAFDMPMSLALWESFVSHETAHAVVERSFAAGVPRRTASEYIAAVVQLGTLRGDLRKSILDRYGAKGFADASEISLELIEFDPAVFAVMAYRHYAGLGDAGPAFIARLLREGLDR